MSGPDRPSYVITPFTAFAAVFAFAIALTFVCAGASLTWNILWTDVLHSNPHRSAWSMIAALPLFTGAVGLFDSVNLIGGIAVAAAVAAASAAILGRVPLILLSVALPAAWLALWLQDTHTPTWPLMSFQSPDDRGVAEITLDRIKYRGVHLMTPALAGSWILLAIVQANRRRRR
jgi:hypothetical protein